MTATARSVRFRLLIDWDADGNYTDESAYFISATGSMSYAPLAKAVLDGRGVVDTMTITLANASGRFSSMNSAGALYSYLQKGGGYRAPVRFYVSIDGSSYIRVFTGVAKRPKETTATTRQIAQVSILCRSREELLMQGRASTSMTNMVAYNAAGYSEADYIKAWLTQQGFTSSDWSIDPGIYAIPWAWLDDESPLEDIWQLAAAAGGRFYADAEGVFRYENACHYRASVVIPVDSLTRSDYASMTVEWPDLEYFDEVTVEIAPRIEAPATVVWEPDGQISIPAGESVTLTARFRQPITSVVAFDWKAKTAKGSEITSDVTLTTPTYYAQRVEYTWTNANDSAAYLYGVQLTGIPLAGSRSEEIVSTSPAVPRSLAERRIKSMRNNVYIQSRAQARSLGAFLLDQYEQGRAVITLSGVPGDPEYRLGNVLTVEDDVLMSAAQRIMITRIDWQANSSGFVQTISGEAITDDMYPYDEYFTLDAHTLDSGQRVFY